MKRNGAVLMMVPVLLIAITVGVVGGIRDSGRNDIIFAPVNFAGVSQVQNLLEDTPHGQMAVNHIQFMSDNLNDRFPFTYQEMHAAAWIVEELLAMGYTWDNIKVQEYTWGGTTHLLPEEWGDIAGIMALYFFADRSPFMNMGTRASQLSQNVILTVPGQSNEVLVVGAHYDSVLFPGASDNASGTALLLESAQRMLNIDNYYTIVYVFFGAEEMGLFGSYYYANSLTRQQHDNIKFMINADVLIEGPELFYMAGHDADGESRANHITETWDNIAHKINAQHGINLMPWPEGVFGPSDQLAFLPFGHTVMFLVGLEMVEGWDDEDEDFDSRLMNMMRVVHSPHDEFHYIKETWPEKMDDNLRGFSIFLEEMLLATYK